MQLVTALTVSDKKLMKHLRGFVPSRVFDIHAHLLTAAQFAAGNRPAMIAENAVLDIAAYHTAMNLWLVPTIQNPSAAQIEGLFFGFPKAGTNREKINEWVAHEVKNAGGNNRALALVSPDDDPAQVVQMMREKPFVGIKVYHCWSSRKETQQSTIEEFAPDWMWKICHEISGVLMLHIVRDRAIADAENQKSLRRLCREYSQCRVVLAHVARSFNYRHAMEGLQFVADLENVWVDTSAITEAESFRAAIDILGPRRVLFGTDYAVSELRGRCVSLGDNFFWLHPETVQENALRKTDDMTLVGIESLLALRDACQQNCLSRGDIKDIFCDNALGLLAPHFDFVSPKPT